MKFKDAGELIAHQNATAKKGKKWINPQVDEEENEYFVPVQDVRAGAFIYTEEIGPRCATRGEAEKYL